MLRIELPVAEPCLLETYRWEAAQPFLQAASLDEFPVHPEIEARRKRAADAKEAKRRGRADDAMRRLNERLGRK